MKSLTYTLVFASGLAVGALWISANKQASAPTYLTRIAVQPAQQILQSSGCLECSRACRAQRLSSLTKGKT